MGAYCPLVYVLTALAAGACGPGVCGVFPQLRVVGGAEGRAQRDWGSCHPTLSFHPKWALGDLFPEHHGHECLLPAGGGTACLGSAMLDAWSPGAGDQGVLGPGHRESGPGVPKPGGGWLTKTGPGDSPGASQGVSSVVAPLGSPGSGAGTSPESVTPAARPSRSFPSQLESRPLAEKQPISLVYQRHSSLVQTPKEHLLASSQINSLITGRCFCGTTAPLHLLRVTCRLAKVFLGSFSSSSWSPEGWSLEAGWGGG